MLKFLCEHKIEDKVIAVGVSGGADSLALALWAAENAKSCGIKIVALTVDHGLRPESSDEAQYVAKILQNFGVEHHILVWKGKKPETGIEEAARIARYNLIKNWCFEHNIGSLMVAHHLLDQTETFFMRIHRGSGLDGLCGMSAVSSYEGLKILRPFLHKHPDEMKEYLRGKNIKWVEDSSNQNEDFLRVKIRKFLPILEQKTGISAQKIVKTMDTLACSRSYIEAQTEKFMQNNCRFIADCAIGVSQSNLANLHREIIYRFLAEALKKIGNRTYQPRAEDLLRLSEKILLDDFCGATLADCEIFKHRNRIWIIPEAKNLPMPTKSQWEEFLQKNPQFARLDMSGKLKRILYHNGGTR